MAHEFMRSFIDTLPLQLTAAERAQTSKGLVDLAAFLQEQYDAASGGVYRSRHTYKPPLWLYEAATSELVTVERTPNLLAHTRIGLLATAGEILRGGSYYSLQSHVVVRFDQSAPGGIMVADEVAPSEIVGLREYTEQRVSADAYRPVNPADFIGVMAASGVAAL